MNGRLLIVVVLGAAYVGLADGIILATVGTAGVSVATAGLVAGAAAVGALAIGALAIAAKGRRRGKRETVSCLPFDNPELFFSMAANSDLLDCSRRFVCELEATAEENLAEEEILIRNVFSRSSTATNGTAGSLYAEAGRLGAIEGVAACATTFSTCPFDRKTIFLAFQDAKTQ
ncbi:uncharacterized protein [Panulirus ornatus]|uniref:uncharacterized protein n=1 Tax=Panulirus ornatus TaxID=150431 RepID=UPI003A86E641